MITKYLIEHDKISKPIIVGFNEHGWIVFFDADCDLTPEQSKWLIERFPVKEEQVKLLQKMSNGKLRVRLADFSLTFDSFWNSYGYKVGKKDKAQKIFERLTEAEKAAAIIGIAKYRRHIESKGTALAYPETYLLNKYFNNDYK